MSEKQDPEKIVREIKRKTRCKFSAEEKIRIVLEGLRGEETIAELCRREGISSNLYYNWSKEFLEAGKRRLLGNTVRQADSTEVTRLRRENGELKHLVADLTLENAQLKKPTTTWTASRTSGEVHALGEAGDHPAGRAVGSACEADAGPAGRRPQHVLRVVQAVSGRGPGRPGQQAFPTPAVLEPDPGPGAGTGGGGCPGEAGPVGPRVGLARDRPGKATFFL